MQGDYMGEEREDEFTPSFSIGDKKIFEKMNDVINVYKTYFGSHLKV